MVRSCQKGLVMALRRQRRARIFQERRNVLEMFGDKPLIKRLHFLSYSKRAKNIYITKQHIYEAVFCAASLKIST